MDGFGVEILLVVRFALVNVRRVEDHGLFLLLGDVQRYAAVVGDLVHSAHRENRWIGGRDELEDRVIFLHVGQMFGERHDQLAMLVERLLLDVLDGLFGVELFDVVGRQEKRSSRTLHSYGPLVRHRCDVQLLDLIAREIALLDLGLVQGDDGLDVSDGETLVVRFGVDALRLAEMNGRRGDVPTSRWKDALDSKRASEKRDRPIVSYLSRIIRVRLPT